MYNPCECHNPTGKSTFAVVDPATCIFTDVNLGTWQEAKWRAAQLNKYGVNTPQVKYRMGLRYDKWLRRMRYEIINTITNRVVREDLNYHVTKYKLDMLNHIQPTRRQICLAERAQCSYIYAR